MATPQERFTEASKALKVLQGNNEVAINTDEIPIVLTGKFWLRMGFFEG